MFKWVNWRSSLTKRILVGIAILATLAVALAFRVLTVFVFDAFVIVLAFICVYEVMQAKKCEERGVRDYYIYPFIAISYLTFLLGILITNPFPIWLHIVLQLVLVFVLCLYVYLMSLTDKAFAKECKLQKLDHKKESRKVVMDYLKVLVYPSLLILTLIPLNHMSQWTSVELESTGELVNVAAFGLFALLLVFVVSMSSDTFAYCVGRILKGKKLAPKISPNKTITGAVGGLFGGMIGALVVGLVMSTNEALVQFLTERIGYAVAVNLFIVFIGLMGSVFTQLGDLYSSWLKRKNGIKDFGKWLPGHGGIMDRVDGIIFNSAFVFFVMMFVVFV